MNHTRRSSRPANVASPEEAARRRELGRLLPLWPQELADLSIEGRRRIVRLLRKALRAERKRGIDGHWAYDLARHAALLRLYKAEQRAVGPRPDQSKSPRHSVIRPPYESDSMHSAS